MGDTKVSKSAGQVLIEKIEGWIKGYIYSPDPNEALILALWSLHTYWTEYLEATPRLCLTGQPGSGKTRRGVLVALLSRAGRLITDITPAAFVTRMDNMKGRFTPIIDEAERFQSGAATLIRAVLNGGYQKGGTVDRRLPNGAVIDQQCYGPMGIIAVGEPTPTLRSRSIIVRATPGTPAREFFRATAEAEAAALRAEVENGKGVFASKPGTRYPAHLRERDAEIWGAIYGVAYALKLDADTMKRVDVFSSDNARYKSDVAARRYREAEDTQRDTQRADRLEVVRLMQDAVTRLQPQAIVAGLVSGADLIDAMKEIPTAGIARNFHGIGLDPVSLAGLIEPFGIRTEVRKPKRIVKGQPTVAVRGYDVAHIKAINVEHIREIKIEDASDAPNISQA